MYGFSAEAAWSATAGESAAEKWKKWKKWRKWKSKWRSVEVAKCGSGEVWKWRREK
jgi:hypothetical protein